MGAVQQQAGQYIQYLTALAGVAVTALTLVLALDRERVNPRVFQLLPTALIAATIASFLAANLMVFVSGLPDAPAARPGSEADAGDLRLFLIAMTTVHIAVALFLFTLMLLPAVYDAQGATGTAQRLGFWSFVFLEGTAAVGLLQMISWRHAPGAPAAVTLMSGLSVALIVYFAFRSGQEGTGSTVAPFVLSTVTVCLAGGYFAVTFHQLVAPRALDVWFYCAASTLPVAALMGLAIRIYREGGMGRLAGGTWSLLPRLTPARDPAGSE